MNVFVGRTAELDTLVGVVASGRSGPAAAIVIGEPGSGKSRLLSEARRRTEVTHSAEVVGYEPGRQVPLAAAASLLRTLMEVPDHGLHLEALLLHADAPRSLEPVRIFEAAHRSFRTLEPALLVIDDPQWMDELSYALCHYLIRAACESGQAVAVFAASRPGQRGPDLLGTLPEERTTRIELAGLSLAEGLELANTLDPDLDPSAARELWEHAGGSPFWLEALVRAHGEASGPGELKALRMHGVTPDASSLLALLAVAGRPLPAAEAAVLLGWPPRRIGALIADLVRRGLASDTGGAAGLAHGLIREAALADLPAETQQGLHRRLAEWLEAGAGDDLRPLREALEHRRAAAMPTVDLARQLASSPRRTLLGSDGLRLLASIADESDPLDSDTVALGGEVAALATELAEHEEALVRWSIVAERGHSPVRRAGALLAASKAAYALARIREARGYLTRSREVESGDDVLALEQDTHEVAILLWLEWRTAAGRALVGDVVSRAAGMAADQGGVERLSPRARRAYLDALRLDYESAFQEGDAPAVLRAATAREDAARGFELEAVLAASLAVGAGLFYNGRIREAVLRLRGLWDETHRHVVPGLTVDVGVWLANTLAQAGDLIDAEQVVGEVVELAARVGDVPRARHRVSRIACEIGLQSRRPREVLVRLEQEAAAESNDHQRIAFLWDVAVWHARLDGADASDQALHVLDEALACSQKVGCPRCASELRIVSAEVLARIGRRAEARGLLAEEADRESNAARQRLKRRHAAALAEDDEAARVEGLRSVLTESSELGLAQLWIRLDLGRALADSGSPEAVVVLTEVADRSAESGAGTVHELADQALRSLGVRTWRRSPTGAPLTEREREIAALVSQGATNREIAGALFLSPKTVERHVTNAMRKLGARNRADLAARTRELEVRDTGNAR